jgi:hypothetical protein
LIAAAIVEASSPAGISGWLKTTARRINRRSAGACAGAGGEQARGGKRSTSSRYWREVLTETTRELGVNWVRYSPVPNAKASAPGIGAREPGASAGSEPCLRTG